jgi:hypothetical protein
MVPERRQQLVLGALLVVLAGLIGWRLWPIPSDQAASPPGASKQRGDMEARSTETMAPDVRLEALAAERPAPGDADRNIFQFEARPAPPPSSLSRAGRESVDRPPAPVAGPAGPAPIALKFIGFVKREAGAEKIAILSDGRGVYHGGEGAIIEGRYRILKIGEESIEMAYLDGQGRRTIRLSGR